MFGLDAGHILNRHIPSGKRYHAGAIGNMKIIKWKPKNENETDRYMLDAKNMSIDDGVRIIKYMSSDKKKIKKTKNDKK